MRMSHVSLPTPPNCFLRGVAIVGFLVLRVGVHAGNGYSFEGLGVPAGHSVLGLIAMSRDGRVIVGTLRSDAVKLPFRWFNGEYRVFTELPKHSFTAVSGDGSTILGSTDGYDAFLWKNNAVTFLGALQAERLGPYTDPRALSTDGRVVVGQGLSTFGEAFRWENGVIIGIGAAPHRFPFSLATGVSGDGKVIVGYTATSRGYEAFRYAEGTLVPLGDLQVAAEFYSKALAISPNGRVIVGTASVGNGLEAFKHVDGVMTGLGGFPTYDVWSEAYSVSDDGNVIVGVADSGTGFEAVIWYNGRPLAKIETLLRQHGLDLSGWFLRAAYSISGDGTIVAGSGERNGVVEPWIATIPLPPPLPDILKHPATQTVQSGGAAHFEVFAEQASAYQWFRDGMAIPGATNKSFTVESVGTTSVGTYSVRVTGPGGSVMSRDAQLYVSPDAADGKLINLSTRSRVDDGARVQIAGFVITGSGTKRVLIRAAGPAISVAPFSVPGTLKDPVLTVYRGSTVLATNDDWSSDPTAAPALRTAFATCGAFSFIDGSRDAAMLLELAPGAYTAQVSDKGSASGIGLVEVYDVAASAENRLVNISTRSVAGSGDALQIAGFVIRGTQSRRVLIRASGPAIAAEPFGLTETASDPALSLYEGTTVLARNDDWSSDEVAAAGVEQTAKRCGAFSWKRGSKDAALVAVLAPGVYTAHVSSGSGIPGIALVEVYVEP
jgi:probable HAF family extracellular repeat protein